MDEESLTVHLGNRPAVLRRAKANGTKIVGYLPGNYVPEELIYASGAVPVCLIDGPNPRRADNARSVLPHIICPFARTQVEEMSLKENPYYSLLDMVIAPITCQHLKKVAEVWEHYGEVEVFKLGIPHRYDGDFEKDYFLDRLVALKDTLEALTGNRVTDEKISHSIELYNKMRDLFRDISLMRSKVSSIPTAMDFITLNHASFQADPAFMVEFLVHLLDTLKNSPNSSKGSRGPRLLLTGPNLARGDYGILKSVERTRGEIVLEEFCEGIRYYWHRIQNTGDSLSSLASGYLRDKVPCAFMRSSARKRLDFILKLIKDFNVSGVIWYELLCCETYDQESYFFEQKLKEHNIPMLIVESNYDVSSLGQLETRLEAFIEVIEGGPENA